MCSITSAAYSGGGALGPNLIDVRNNWKWIGLAGAVGVAAGGVLVVRDQRRRKAYTPDEIRSRLHQRLAEAQAAQGTKPD